MDERRQVEIFIAETKERQLIELDEERTTHVQLRGARPTWVFELEAAHAWRPGGLLPLPDPDPARALEGRGLLPLALAAEHLAAHPDHVALAAGHAPDAALAARRARVVLALLAGDAADLAVAAAEAPSADLQALLGWLARARGIDCDPGRPDGQVGPRTRAAIAAFRAAQGVAGGPEGGLGADDWRAVQACYDQELARALELPALPRGSLRLARPEGVGCAAAWPAGKVMIKDHTALADERVDLLCFAPQDVPALRCHADGGACDPKGCDVYRKGKYRCERCHPRTPGAGFRCLEVEGPHFDFDRALVRPDGFPALAAVGALLAEDPRRVALVFGHTDTTGDEGYNLALSQRRADAALALLTHDLAALDALWTAEGWGAPEQAALLAAAGAPDVRAFQRSAGLDPDGVVGPRTRRALLEAYCRAAAPQPAAAARFAGRRALGCGELNPVGDGLDERSRRVVVMVMDPERVPRDLPCLPGQLAPCRAHARPAPAGAEGSTFRCAVYRRLAASCACRQDPKPQPPPVPPPPVPPPPVPPPPVPPPPVPPVPLPFEILAFTGVSTSGGKALNDFSVNRRQQGSRLILAWSVLGLVDEVIVSHGEGDAKVEVHRSGSGTGVQEVTQEAAQRSYTLKAISGGQELERQVHVKMRDGPTGPQKDRTQEPLFRVPRKALVRPGETRTLLELPARALTLVEAAHVVACLAQEGRIQLCSHTISGAKAHFPHFDEDGSKLLYPGPEPLAAGRWAVSIDATVRSSDGLPIEVCLLNNKGGADRRNPTLIDVRMVVALCHLVEALAGLRKRGVTVTRLHHIGFQGFQGSRKDGGSGGLYDAHMSGRAIDFGGVTAQLADGVERFVLVSKRWGDAKLPQGAPAAIPRPGSGVPVPGARWPHLQGGPWNYVPIGNKGTAGNPNATPPKPPHPLRVAYDEAHQGQPAFTATSFRLRGTVADGAKPSDEAGIAELCFEAAYDALSAHCTVTDGSDAQTYDPAPTPAGDLRKTPPRGGSVLYPDFPSDGLQREDHFNHIHANLGHLAYEWPDEGAYQRDLAKAKELKQKEPARRVIPVSKNLPRPIVGVDDPNEVP
ncbi:MAG: peptidoglycan-binding protein [Planctomycetota bacterium]